MQGAQVTRVMRGSRGPGGPFRLAAVLAAAGLLATAAAGTNGLTPLGEVPVLETPPLDIATARAASVTTNAGVGVLGGGPVPFATPFAVNVTPVSHGRWESGGDGLTAVWRLRVASADAISLNLGFGRYRMPPGGRLWVYTPAGDQILGPYTDADNEEHGELWTPILSGGDAVIEVAVPVERIGDLDLRLDAVNRGFRDPAVVQSASHASCNVDAACPPGDSYRDQIRSVGQILVGGTAGCTASLLNNTAADSRLYLLTAHHCFVDPAREAASVVVYWNYQRPLCGAGTADKSDSQSGAVLRVARSDADIVLLELDDEPDPAHKLHLAGWSRDPLGPNSGVTIHHPKSHVKSINATRNSVRPSTDGLSLTVRFWDWGAVEPGSSGAPLFDHDGRVAGVASDTGATCANTAFPTVFGALAGAWTEAGGSSTRQLSDWLDPGGTGAISIGGMDPSYRPRSLRALDDKAVKVPAAGESAEALSVDLAAFFRDPDGDALTYTATSSNTSAVTVSVSGSSVTLTPVAAGSATITVTVTETGGSRLSITETFTATAGDYRSPETLGTLADQSLNSGATVNIDYSEAFSEGALAFSLSSTDTSVATAELGAPALRIRALRAGTATIDLAARDHQGSNTTARHRFAVTVLNNPPAAVGTLNDAFVRVDDLSQRVDVAQAFSDPEGDQLTYGAGSSHPDTIRARPSGSTITLSPVRHGDATITVTAVDFGGSGTPATQTFDVQARYRPEVQLSFFDDDGVWAFCAHECELTVVEGSTATYDVHLNDQPTGEVTITPSVVSSSDVSVSPSSLTFDPADWPNPPLATVTVTGVQDNDATAETVTIRHAVSGADYDSVQAPSMTVTTVDDDDPSPAVSVGPAWATESGGSLTFNVSLGYATPQVVTVDYATSDGYGSGGARAGSDYVAASGTLTFPANSTTQKIAVSVRNDDDDEEEQETLRLTLWNPQNAFLSGGVAKLQAVGTIQDDDDPRVTASFGKPSYHVTEGQSVIVTVRLDRDPERNVRIYLNPRHYGGASYADYSGVPASVVFGPGARTRSFQVRAFADGVAEPGEAVELRLSAASSRVTADGRTTISIRDGG